MTLSAPTKLCFLISLILFVLALLGAFGVIGAIANYDMWLFIGAWVVLAAGNALKGF